jgi:hypothetical protein
MAGCKIAPKSRLLGCLVRNTKNLDESHHESLSQARTLSNSLPGKYQHVHFQLVSTSLVTINALTLINYNFINAHIYSQHVLQLLGDVSSLAGPPSPNA